MSKRDYYEVLGVSRDVDVGELKKTYRRLAMKYHPDQNPDDDQAEAKFKELTEAYQVLSDPKKRSMYDRFGHDAPDVGFGGTAVDISSMTDFFESIFGSVFGGAPRRRRRRGRPGRDLQYDLVITLEQAVSGQDLKITFPRPVRCPDCGGTGASPGTKPRQCSQCDGQGAVRLQQGIFSVSSTCPICKGTGEVIVQACGKCEGMGLVVEDQEVEVTVPSGVDDGAVKILPGFGEQGRGDATDGDLHVMVHVKEHEHFIRRGQDLHTAIRISYPQAVLGADAEVPTIDGHVSMRIKPGTESGQVYRLKGMGVPFLRGSRRGDQHVHVEIDIPKKLTRRQRELIELIGHEFNDSVQHAPRSLLDKIKHIFD